MCLRRVQARRSASIQRPSRADNVWDEWRQCDVVLHGQRYSAKRTVAETSKLCGVSVGSMRGGLGK
jgi:hypothetical protein